MARVVLVGMGAATSIESNLVLDALISTNEASSATLRAISFVRNPASISDAALERVVNRLQPITDATADAAMILGNQGARGRRFSSKIEDILGTLKQREDASAYKSILMF